MNHLGFHPPIPLTIYSARGRKDLHSSQDFAAELEDQSHI